MAKKVKYKRVILKLSGEVLMGERNYGIDSSTVDYMASEDLGVLMPLLNDPERFRGMTGIKNSNLSTDSN